MMCKTCGKASCSGKGGCSKDGKGGGGNWIAGATKNKGALHRALGVPEGQKIPGSKIAAAAKAGGKLGREGRLAQTLAKLRKKK